MFDPPSPQGYDDKDKDSEEGYGRLVELVLAMGKSSSESESDEAEDDDRIEDHDHENSPYGGEELDVGIGITDFSVYFALLRLQPLTELVLERAKVRLSSNFNALKITSDLNEYFKM